jgi:crossover junction endodeoxyribonuclease RuvC
VRVLGIDPGLGRCGFAVLEVEGRSTRAISYGTVATGPGPVAARLAQLAARLRAVIGEFQPDVGAIERLFVNRNTRTAMTVGQASGVALLVAAEAGLPVASYTPSQVKLAVTGTGDAPKAQIGFMVKALLGLPAPARPADSADAIAVALCHIQHSDLAEGVGATVGRTGGGTPAEVEARWLRRAAPTSPSLGRAGREPAAWPAPGGGEPGR